MRRVEWRLFGFGMMQFLSNLTRWRALRAPVRERVELLSPAHRNERRPQYQRAEFSGLDPAAQPSQRLPAGIFRTLFAGTGLGVAIGSAARAKSFTIRLAQRSGRQGQ